MCHYYSEIELRKLLGHKVRCRSPVLGMISENIVIFRNLLLDNLTLDQYLQEKAIQNDKSVNISLLKDWRRARVMVNSLNNLLGYY